MTWVLAICLLAALAGCNDGAGEGEALTARDLTGTVAGWQEGAADVSAALFDGAVLRPIAQGTVDAAGAVHLGLPAEVADELLVPIDALTPCAEVDAIPDEARVAVLFSLTVSQEGRPLGAIAQASSEAATFPAPTEQGAYRVYRWYADRDATAHGTCASASGGYRFVHRWALELERGWNVVVEVIAELADDDEVRETRTASLPPGTRWYFLDAMAAPE